jgi:hypothetical protein
MSVRLQSVSRAVVTDDDPDTSYLEQEGFEDRLAAYRDGAFHFVGVRAVAVIMIKTKDGLGLHYEQRILTPGVWSIESDFGEDHIEEVYQEELGTLREMLAELGIVPDDETLRAAAGKTETMAAENDPSELRVFAHHWAKVLREDADQADSTGDPVKMEPADCRTLARLLVALSDETLRSAAGE